jgi:hypothetical protein
VETTTPKPVSTDDLNPEAGFHYPTAMARTLLLVIMLGACFIAIPIQNTDPCATRDQHDLRAELFATNKTSASSSPNDDRLRSPLDQFAIQVNRIIRQVGGVTTGSTAVEGIYWSSAQQKVSYNRSREFQLCGVDVLGLHAIAQTVRRQFNQLSVLTFRYLSEQAPEADAVEIIAPRVDVNRLYNAFDRDPAVRDRLQGGSLTDDHTLILVVAKADLALATGLVLDSAESPPRLTWLYGTREFVD